MVKQKTERLILLVMGVILNMTVINQAVMLMDNENAFYCPVHFFYAAKVLDKIMKVRSDGTVSSVGLSILQVLANKVLVDFVEKRSLYWSLRRFMALYSESSELVSWKIWDFKELQHASGVQQDWQADAWELPTIYARRCIVSFEGLFCGIFGNLGYFADWL